MGSRLSGFITWTEVCEGPPNRAKLNKSDSMLTLHGFPNYEDVFDDHGGVEGGDTTIEGARQRCLVGGGGSARVSYTHLGSPSLQTNYGDNKSKGHPCAVLIIHTDG